MRCASCNPEPFSIGKTMLTKNSGVDRRVGDEGRRTHEMDLDPPVEVTSFRLPSGGGGHLQSSTCFVR